MSTVEYLPVLVFAAIDILILGILNRYIMDALSHRKLFKCKKN